MTSPMVVRIAPCKVSGKCLILFLSFHFARGLAYLPRSQNYVDVDSSIFPFRNYKLPLAFSFLA